MKLLGARVMVKVLEEEVTAGGIVMPDQAQSNLSVATGKVFAVGDGDVNLHPKSNNGSHLPMRVRKGDRIKFFMASAFPCRYEDEDYMLVAEDIVIMILDEE